MKQSSVMLLPVFIFLLLFNLHFASAPVIDADYITIYPGEQGKITLDIDNNENFDIEDVSVNINLDNLPFSSVGSSEKNIDDIDEDDDDSVTFTIKASTSITPGDYDIPYSIKYVNSDNDEKLSKSGSFGLRVGAKTEIDFSAEARGEEISSAIVGREGKISLEIINRGLGEIKSVNVKITPQGFELLSKDNVFVGTIEGDDTDIASFDVIYKNTNPRLIAEVTYNDFDNKDQIENVEIPFKVYTEEQALQLGIIKKSNTMVWIIVIIVILIAWFVYRKIRKANRNKLKGGNR